MCIERQSRFADLTGKVIGKLAVVESLGGEGHGEQWLCLCSCGTEVTRSHRILYEAFKASRDLVCDSCRRGVRERKVRSKGRCGLCAGMPWRVQGPRCRRCKLLYGEQPLVHAVVAHSQSSGNGMYEDPVRAATSPAAHGPSRRSART
jgi:hypothetical protein